MKAPKPIRPTIFLVDGLQTENKGSNLTKLLNKKIPIAIMINGSQVITTIKFGYCFSEFVNVISYYIGVEFFDKEPYFISYRKIITRENFQQIKSVWNKAGAGLIHVIYDDLN